jgi:hypothetical protein
MKDLEERTGLVRVVEEWWRIQQVW